MVLVKCLFMRFRTPSAGYEIARNRFSQQNPSTLVLSRRPRSFRMPRYTPLSPDGGCPELSGDFWSLAYGDDSQRPCIERLVREFHPREPLTVQVRGEAFNITNSFRAGALSNGLPTGASGVVTSYTNTFGQILSALDPRILQFAVKLVF